MIVLASGSPRRREILTMLRIPHEVRVSDAPEVRAPGEAPTAYALRVATDKARTVGVGLERHVLAADTIVTLEGDVLGKPADDDEARRVLTRLAGRAHEVVTAIVVLEPSGRVTARAITSHVTFRTLDAAAIDRYVATQEGRDKAGAYGIQGLASGFVSELRGSQTNVMGLPASETVELLLDTRAITAWPLP